MQPARLGALAWCFVSAALLVLLVLVPFSRAQQPFLRRHNRSTTATFDVRRRAGDAA